LSGVGSVRTGSYFLTFCFFALSLVLLDLFITVPGYALSKDDDIDTNRPSFTDSALVVPKGSLQFENGTTYQHFQHGITNYDIPETEVRLGLTNSTEFQMFVPNWVLLNSPGASTIGLTNTKPTSSSVSVPAGTTSGVADLTEIGIKHQVRPLFKNLTLSAIVGVNAPTGTKPIAQPGAQPVIRTPWSYALNKNWSACGMQSILVVNDWRDVQWQNFWLLCRTFGARTTVFIEYAGFYTHQASPSNIMHFGVVRKLNKNNQVDLHFGFGLDKTAPAAFVGAGYSFRLDRLPIPLIN
jgi:hypothetical protein